MNEKGRNNSIRMFPNIFFSIIALYVSIVYIMEDIYAREHIASFGILYRFCYFV